MATFILSSQLGSMIKCQHLVFVLCFLLTLLQNANILKQSTLKTQEEEDEVLHLLAMKHEPILL